MEQRSEALTLVNWRLLETEDNLWSPVRIFCGPQVCDRDFYPLFRRFLAACCRELDDRLTDESRKALDVIEAFAYGRASFEEFVSARNAAKIAARRAAKQRGAGSRGHAAAAVRDSARNDAFEAMILCCYQLRQAGMTDRRMAESFERVAAKWIAEDG